MRTTNTIKLQGVDYVPVKVECKITPGIGIHLVGLADIAVKESLLRTITAMQANAFRIPGKRVIINLAPADLCKKGCHYDLPIALATIAESGQAEMRELERMVVVGELALDGRVRSVPGVVKAVQAAVDNGFGVIIPRANAKEVAELFADYSPIYPVGTLREAIEVAETLRGDHIWDLPEVQEEEPEPQGWWDRIPGQYGAKRALEIAAAGRHHMLMIGAPGSMKAALGKAMLDILPPMSKEEAMEVAKIWSAAGRNQQVKRRPFRAPHISASVATWAGGGAGDTILPGEVSLAHNGVLYVDQFAEIPRVVGEFLRGPVEDGKVVIGRLRSKVEYPSRFQLILASNPCPCGYYGEGDRCTCTKGVRERYMARLSGPVIDHVDVQVWVHPELPENVSVTGDPASVVAERVLAARERQMKRQGKLNSELDVTELSKFVPAGNEELSFLEEIITKMGLSARAFSRMVKIAMTIADLEGAERVRREHLAEAACYRFLDRTQVL